MYTLINKTSTDEWCQICGSKADQDEKHSVSVCQNNPLHIYSWWGNEWVDFNKAPIDN